jgi:membrane-bound serine protease (ClpP class)
VPVVTFVSPTGARAASAGTYILYASHIAAMSPGTNLGAATPVQIGGVSPADKKSDKDGKQPPMDAGKKKAINDAVAYIRGLAQLRGRNQEWAEKAVREAASLPAEDALKQGVIDLIASNMVDLLKQLDGREVTLQGQSRSLQTTGKPLIQYLPDWRSRLLGIITNPNIAYILMLVGIYGLIFEFSSPGAILPGTVGAICLLLALYSFQLLPINYAGMALILLGIGLMVGEAYQPSFGVLGIGGVIAFVIGSIILMDTEAPGFGIDLAVIATFTLASILMFVVIVGMALGARKRPVVSGMEQLVGGIATVIEDFDQQGRVRIQSESWNAVCDQPLSRQQQVKVIGIDGLVLKVQPLSGSTQEEQS